MTRKHFEAIAQTIRETTAFASEDDRHAFAWTMARTLGEFNAAFDRARFMVACAS